MSYDDKKDRETHVTSNNFLLVQMLKFEPLKWFSFLCSFIYYAPLQDSSSILTSLSLSFSHTTTTVDPCILLRARQLSLVIAAIHKNRWMLTLQPGASSNNKWRSSCSLLSSLSLSFFLFPRTWRAHTRRSVHLVNPDIQHIWRDSCWYINYPSLGFFVRFRFTLASWGE